MSQLTLLVLQLGFLLLLWVFVFAIVYALRSDLFGQRVRRLVAEPSAAPVTASTPTDYPSSPLTPGAGIRVPSQNQAGAAATTDNARVLVITSGNKRGVEFPLAHETITLGRSSDSTIVIRDDYTSTYHARLMLWNGSWMLQDLDSTNGTLLDGQRVHTPTPVPLGATIKVGATTFELRG